ncbi:MAG TPA: C-terminal binding protein [Planctomycetaceae bacterium]|nr:C-terminal binding protein [Planctomycetaceae bacterium]|tara:strand:+ start:1639 stop:2625 length:987 start_codon:yes stop_codon:yes gene_type:complete
MADGFRVLITDRAWPDSQIEQEILREVGAEVLDAPDTSESTLLDLASGVDAIAACWAQVTLRLLDAAPNCRIVARFGIGLDNIPVDACTQRHIPVTFVPDYCIPEVADHTIALLLSAVRKTAFFHLNTKQGEYQLAAGPPLRRLSGLTLGLVGLGRIARAVVPRARALGLNVVATTPSGEDHGTDCPMVPFEDLLRSSDVVSLHCPLSDDTHHMINRTSLDWLQSHAVLINTSRGGLIDHTAAWEALQQDRIGGLALDVFDPEPPDLSDPLFADHRVIATPHAAFLSQESVEELRRRTAHQIADVLSGRMPEHVVNPETCGHLTADGS